MNLTEWSNVLGNFGEFAGAILLFISLFYVAVQIRQNTVAMRATARQTLIDKFYELGRDFGTSPELGEILAKGMADFTSMAEEDKRQFGWIVQSFEGNLYNGLLLHEANLLDTATLEQIGDNWVAFVRRGGGKDWYEATVRIPLVEQYVRKRLKEAGDKIPEVERQLHRADTEEPEV